MHTHTYTHIHQSVFKKRKTLAITLRASPWPRPTLRGIPAALADLEAPPERQRPLPLRSPYVNFSGRAWRDSISVPKFLYVILFSRSPFQFSFILFFKLRKRPVLGGKDCKCWLESSRGGGQILLGQGLTLSAFFFFTCTVRGVDGAALRSIPLPLSLVKNRRSFLLVIDFAYKQSGKIRIL